MLSVLVAAALAAGTQAPVWTDGLTWQGAHVGMSSDSHGDYTLHALDGQRVIDKQPLLVKTASPLFDGLFAMAQDDLTKDSVTAIRDGAFDNGQPIPCHCFETGEKWHYVWTRDLSYAIDLGLWRFDAERSRNGLKFKLSEARMPSTGKGAPSDQRLVMQDTGSGGSWPISTDRVVWFLGARHLLGDKAFAADVYAALGDTLAQDRQYTYDPRLGLYRGETSFLDWRQQTYPDWTADSVGTIGQSFALSTNVLHYQALTMAADMAGQHGAAKAAASYRTQAAALKTAINAHFWRASRGMYMSYIGGDGMPVDTYDLLGITLAITSGVADGKRAAQTLSNYPTWPAGSPVIWPERKNQPIYHNRAIWPFVSAYALRAARKVDQPARIAHEIESVIRGAALNGSNMENQELLTQNKHVDDGKLSGPVINSPRQLWSVGAYFAMVTEGVFGLNQDGSVQPKLPSTLVPMLFGERHSISITLPHRSITLQLPKQIKGNLLVADHIRTDGNATTVQLKAITVKDAPLRTDAPLYGPHAPATPTLSADGKQWSLKTDGKVQLYVNGKRAQTIDGTGTLPNTGALTCVSATRIDAQGIESLPSREVCVGELPAVTGDWPRTWKAPADGAYRASLNYSNDHGTIETGVTAAVKMLAVTCGDNATQKLPLVMPHSVREERSTYGRFTAKAGQTCRFALEDGFNMSYLSNFSHYTGGQGGTDGPLNKADVHGLVIAPLGRSGK